MTTLKKTNKTTEPMKYYIDTEFFESFQKPLFGKRRHFIDLISIGMVCEDGRTLYLVGNEFDVDKIWKDDWLRENVLRPLHKELAGRQSMYAKTYHPNLFLDFSPKCLKNLIAWHGDSNKNIADTIAVFVKDEEPQFYGYYCDYDWVLFCSLFGRMIDLPKNFPMYCRDLKQTLDEWAASVPVAFNIKEGLTAIKLSEGYPKEDNAHNALSDAQWNKQLHDFITANYKP